MDDQAYLRVEYQLRELASRVGTPTLGDGAIATGRRLEGGERLPLLPRERLLARLEALERHLTTVDRGTYNLAMSKINRVLISSAERMDRPPEIPTKAFVVAELPGQADPVKIPLESLPDLSEPLRRIRLLIAQVQEDADGQIK